MARITVEDCLKKVDNRFGLIHLSAKRVRQLRKGDEPLIKCKNKNIVTSLREIAAGKVFQVRKEEYGLLGSEDIAEDVIPEALPENTHQETEHLTEEKTTE